MPRDPAPKMTRTEATAVTARRLYEANKGRIPLSECRKHVEHAREQGDRKRENGNR